LRSGLIQCDTIKAETVCSILEQTMKSVPVRVSDPHLSDIDAMVLEGRYQDRAEALRAALFPFCQAWRAQKAQTEKGAA
jgi:Arc/MetJ-type ribon-helix-helix transcriptional regulator